MCCVLYITLNTGQRCCPIHYKSQCCLANDAYISKILTNSAADHKFRGAAHFRGKTSISVAWLKIPQAAEDCGP